MISLSDARPLIVAIAARSLPCRDIDPEDVAHDALLRTLEVENEKCVLADRLWEDGAPELGGSILDDWHPVRFAVACVRRMCADAKRSRARYKALLGAWETDRGDRYEDRTAELSDLQRATIRALRALRPEDRYALEGRAAGVRYQALSDALDMPIGTLHRRVERARRQLREAVLGSS